MTYKMQKFNKYDLWQRWVKDLAKIQKEAKDVEIHTLFNNPTSTTYGAGLIRWPWLAHLIPDWLPVLPPTITATI